jgi:hypothetical protein
MSRLIHKLWAFLGTLLFGDTAAILDEFLEKFPGRCPICSLDRAAEQPLNRNNHDCPEKKVVREIQEEAK